MSVHGVALRTASTVAWAETRLGDRAPRPVVQVAGRVAERAHVGAARDVQRAPQRLARHGHDDGAARDAGRLGERAARVGDELQHLDEADEVERVVGERQRLRVADDVLDARVGGPVRGAGGRTRRRGRSPARPARAAIRRVTMPSPQPTSSSVAGAAAATSASSSAKNDATSRRTIGLRRARTCRTGCRRPGWRTPRR